jgi:hypothetical protein
MKDIYSMTATELAQEKIRCQNMLREIKRLLTRKAKR